MGFDTGELTSIWEIEAARTREQDRQDFERELAGIDIGRTARFHNAEFVEERQQGRSGASTAGRRERSEYASRLQMLLATDPVYARLYNDTSHLLDQAEAATDRAIAKAEAALKTAQEQLERTLHRAATLPDGTRVFRDKWGNVWNEARERVSDADAARIEWRGNEPAYEQFLEESEAVSGNLARLEELQGFRVDTLGRFRDRMTDRDNPPSADEMEQFRREMKENMPEAVRVELTRDTASIAPTMDAGIAAPVRTL